ncbi:hypothetical protein NKT34_18550 [Paenibacillus polysaccharolyticus]|uniref:hypothetical protein n=1 Tax=Paenibacillus TaxID=44249 RepID=UPI00119CA5EB|nr:MULTISPECIES: hypothetical protein [Paenibacillus]MCP1135304.1 hypothetical protein [Paenibacillus polysaccharolyticus]
MLDNSKYMNDFLEAKKEYVSFREKERKRIQFHLAQNGYTVEKGSREGKGVSNYTNGGRLDKKFDLTNWKWVEATKGNISYFISLQAFDRDAIHNNYHVLLDRIGICAFHLDTKEIERDYFKCMDDTSLDLPLSENDLKELLRLLEQLKIKE